MSAIKFNHVFAALLLLAGASAFAIPEKYTTKVQPNVQGLFTPVASPVSRAAGWVHARVARPEAPDVRDARTLSAQVDLLQVENAHLRHALEELQRVNADRQHLGKDRDAFTPVPVTGFDAGSRQSLQVRGSTLDGLREGMFVMHTSGVVGLITRPPGLLGAQVRLITDRGVRVTCYFRKSNRTERAETPPAVVEGTGDGAMRCLGLTVEEIEKAKLAPGDWVMLEDKDWDDRLHGQRLGKIAGITPLPTAPLYAEIRVEPTKNLMMLREVMVLTK